MRSLFVAAWRALFDASGVLRSRSLRDRALKVSARFAMMLATLTCSVADIDGLAPGAQLPDGRMIVTSEHNLWVASKSASKREQILLLSVLQHVLVRST